MQFWSVLGKIKPRNDEKHIQMSEKVFRGGLGLFWSSKEVKMTKCCLVCIRAQAPLEEAWVLRTRCMNRRTKRYINDHFYVTLTCGTIFDRPETQTDKKKSSLHQPRVAWCNHDVFLSVWGSGPPKMVPQVTCFFKNSPFYHFSTPKKLIKNPYFEPQN